MHGHKSKVDTQKYTLVFCYTHNLIDLPLALEISILIQSNLAWTIKLYS